MSFGTSRMPGGQATRPGIQDGPRSGARHLAASRCRRPGSALLLMAFSGLATAAGPGQEPAPRFWGDFGVGFGRLNAGSAPSGDDGGGVVVDLTVGARLSEHWLVGVNLGGIGTQLSTSYYDPNDRYSSIYGQSVTNVFLTAQFEPAGDAGWLYGGGAGEVLYHNHALERLTGTSRSGDGTGAELHVGYDWRFPEHLHVETRLGVERGRVSLNGAIGGSFAFTAVGLSVHVAFH
jgi:hypothetical protein